MSYSDIAVRAHCPECGSTLSMQYKCQPEVMSITAGTFDEGSIEGQLPKVGSHIFVEGTSALGGEGEKGEGEKIGGWYELPRDGAPRYPKHTVNFQKMIDSWERLL